MIRKEEDNKGYDIRLIPNRKMWLFLTTHAQLSNILTA